MIVTPVLMFVLPMLFVLVTDRSGYTETALEYTALLMGPYIFFLGLPIGAIGLIWLFVNILRYAGSED